MDSLDATTGIRRTVRTGVMDAKLLRPVHGTLPYQNVLGSGDTRYLRDHPEHATAFKMHVAAHYARGDWMAAPHGNFGGIGQSWDPDPAAYQDIFRFISRYAERLFNPFTQSMSDAGRLEGAKRVGVAVRAAPGDPNRLIAHLVNRGYDSTRHDAVKKRDFTLIIAARQLPDGAAIQSARLFSYDGPNGAALSVRRDGRTWRVAIPVLRVWDVIEISLVYS